MAGVDILASAFSGANAAFLGEQYARWATNPASVDPSFAELFGALNDEARAVLEDATGASWTPHPLASAVAEPPAAAPAPAGGATIARTDTRAEIIASLRALMLIRSYRVRGHLEAHLDPLGLQLPKPHPELDPKSYGFTDADWDRAHLHRQRAGPRKRHAARDRHHPARDLLRLDRRRVHAHPGPRPEILDPAARWKARPGAPPSTAPPSARFLQGTDRGRRLRDVLPEALRHARSASAWKAARSTIPAMHAIIETCGAAGVQEIAIGMPHRGRLNTLVNVVKKPLTAVFSEFGGESFKPDDVQGSGDVKYHLGTSTDLEIAGRTVHLSLAAQPVASRSGRSCGGRQGARAAGPGRRHPAPPFGDGDPDARRRRLRRAGTGV